MLLDVLDDTLRITYKTWLLHGPNDDQRIVENDDHTSDYQVLGDGNRLATHNHRIRRIPIICLWTYLQIWA